MFPFAPPPLSPRTHLGSLSLASPLFHLVSISLISRHVTSRHTCHPSNHMHTRYGPKSAPYFLSSHLIRAHILTIHLLWSPPRIYTLTPIYTCYRSTPTFIPAIIFTLILIYRCGKQPRHSFASFRSPFRFGYFPTYPRVPSRGYPHQSYHIPCTCISSKPRPRFSSLSSLERSSSSLSPFSFPLVVFYFTVHPAERLPLLDYLLALPTSILAKRRRIYVARP